MNSQKLINKSVFLHDVSTIEYVKGVEYQKSLFDEIISIKSKNKPQQPPTANCTFAKAMDKFGKIHYLSAYTEEEIDKHCDGGVLGDDLAVVEYAYNVSPIVAAHHFTWVG